MEINYPRELVEEYGAKAGILMYVQQQLPDIPQMPMLVRRPSDSLDDFVEQVGNKGEWRESHLLVRSSAEVEIEGFEGAFPTLEVRDPTNKKYIRDTVERVSTSATEVIQDLAPWQQHYKDKLPRQIATIVTPVSPSKYTGTFIKHPNQNGFYIVSISVSDTIDSYNPIRGQFFVRNGRVKELTQFQSVRLDRKRKDMKDLFAEHVPRESISDLVKIHNQIARLPLMDRDWTWQIEFGLEPFFLYQVRPFKKVEKPKFKLKPLGEMYRDTIPIGITPSDGVKYRVIKNVWGKSCQHIPINPEGHEVVHIGKLRDMSSEYEIPNLRANLIEDIFGCLAHSDVAAIRRADFSAYNISGSYGRNGKNYLSFDRLADGDEVWIISDGENVIVEKEKRGKRTKSKNL